MLKFYDSALWLANYGDRPWFSTFHHPKFLRVHADVYNVKPIHFTFSYKEDIVFAVSTFEKNRKLVTPNHFLYTGFWINDRFSDMQVLMFQKEMLALLKSLYHGIKFHLPVEISDVRAFVWSGFKFSLMHTYEKDLSMENYHSNITRMLKKVDPGFNFIVGQEDFDAIVEVHKKDFYKFGIRKKYIKDYLPLLKRLRENGFLLDMNLKRGDEIVASNLVLLNKEQKKAYIVLIARSDQWYQFGTHAKIYHQSFKYLVNAGYEIVDLFGADVPGFALFKLKFSVELKHCYQVFYDRKTIKLQKAIAIVKFCLKKYFL